jgi:hypothetical protein
MYSKRWGGSDHTDFHENAEIVSKVTKYGKKYSYRYTK